MTNTNLEKLYYYRAQVIRVVDGDTLKVGIDLGFNLTHTTNIRLARINCPETRGAEREEGLNAKNWVIENIPLGSDILIHSTKLGKYGRPVAEVWVNSLNINDTLVEEGFAEYIDYA